MSKIQLPGIKPERRPWNTGRLVGQKRPLPPKQVWVIRTRLELAGNLRGLALFNLETDSKLRGGDLVRLKVADLVSGDSLREPVSVIRHCFRGWIAFRFGRYAARARSPG